MNTYTVNVNIGTTVQIILSANDEDEAEERACKEIAEKLNKEIVKFHKHIKVIEAEVVDTIENIELQDMIEMNKEENEN